MNRRLGLLCLAFMVKSSSSGAADGQALFNENCAPCHQSGGIGSPGLAPPLADRALWDHLSTDAPRYLAGVMLAGLSGSIEVDGVKYTGLVMPSQARITDEDLSTIGTYVLSALNGSVEKLSTAAVAECRAAPPTHATLRELRKAKSK
jgi:mono/diheme cytochrome c family protein